MTKSLRFLLGFTVTTSLQADIKKSLLFLNQIGIIGIKNIGVQYQELWGVRTFHQTLYPPRSSVAGAGRM